MSKPTKLLLTIFITLLPIYVISYIYIANNRDITGKLLRVKTNTITAIKITNPTNNIILSKNEKGFVFSQPFAGIAADDDVIKKYFTLLSKLTVKRDLGAYDENAAQTFGITPASARIELQSSGKKTVFIVGKRNPVDPQNYIYVPEMRKLLLSENIIEMLCNTRPEDFRKRGLFTFDSGDVKAIEIQLLGARNLTFAKEAGDWYVRDVKAGREYLCDSADAQALAERAAKLLINDFAPLDKHIQLNNSGLKAPHASLLIATSSSPVHRLDIGNTYKDNLQYVALDGEVRGGISSQFLLQISTPTSAYFRTTLADFLPARLISFTSSSNSASEVIVTYDKQRGKWYRTAKKRRPFEDDKIDSFMNAIFSLKVGTFIFNEPLGTVEKEFSFYDRTGRLLMCLQIGGRYGDYIKAQLKGKRSVFGIEKGLVDKLDL